MVRRQQRLLRIRHGAQCPAGEDRGGGTGAGPPALERTGQAARVFIEFEHETATGSWSQSRRVVAKAEHIDGKSNPRFIVTSLPAQTWAAQPLYEELYCARGDMENRIKEQFVLFADRVSAATMRANQLRLYLSVIAYALVAGLRRLGLKATELATAQVARFVCGCSKSALRSG